MSKKRKYFSKEAARFAAVLNFLEENGIANSPQRFKVIRYLLERADENGVVNTTYEKVAKDIKDIDLATVGKTFRLLMRSGLVTMSRAEYGKTALTEYTVRTEALKEIVGDDE